MKWICKHNLLTVNFPKDFIILYCFVLFLIYHTTLPNDLSKRIYKTEIKLTSDQLSRRWAGERCRERSRAGDSHWPQVLLKTINHLGECVFCPYRWECKQIVKIRRQKINQSFAEPNLHVWIFRLKKEQLTKAEKFGNKFSSFCLCESFMYACMQIKFVTYLAVEFMMACTPKNGLFSLLHSCGEVVSQFLLLILVLNFNFDQMQTFRLLARAFWLADKWMVSRLRNYNFKCSAEADAVRID